MHKLVPRSYLGMTIALGAVWGLSEAALGMGLRSCAAFVSGSLMTGVALFFLAAGWVVSKRVSGIVVMVIVASLFKMFDALLLSLPLNHGAIGNPIFAFFMEAAAFVIIVYLVKETISKKPGGQALIGGLSAVLAVNLFPLVKYATGVPACVAAGTGYPLSLYYIHFAVLVSLIAVPLGFWVGAKADIFEARLAGVRATRKLGLVVSPLSLILCLAILALMRLV